MTFPKRAVTKLTGHNGNSYFHSLIPLAAHNTIGPVHCVTFSAGLGQYVCIIIILPPLPSKFLH